MMLSREAVRCVAQDYKVFDELFSPGYFEDDDLGIRLARAGFEQYVCKNAFIYHNGGTGFAENENAMTESRNKFVDIVFRGLKPQMPSKTYMKREKKGSGFSILPVASEQMHLT